MIDPEKIYDRIFELPNTPRSMLRLLDDFPEATPEDFWMAFRAIASDHRASSLPSEWTGKAGVKPPFQSYGAVIAMEFFAKSLGQVSRVAPAGTEAIGADLRKEQIRERFRVKNSELRTRFFRRLAE